MAYRMRFFPALQRADEFTLPMIRKLLREGDGRFDISSNGPEAVSELTWSDDLFAELELGRNVEPERQQFDDVASQLPADSPELVVARAVIENAPAVLIARLLNMGTRTDEESFAVLDQVWTTLFEHFGGILQADAEGYYDESGLLVPE